MPDLDTCQSYLFLVFLYGGEETLLLSSLNMCLVVVKLYARYQSLLPFIHCYLLLRGVEGTWNGHKDPFLFFLVYRIKRESIRDLSLLPLTSLFIYS